MRTDGGAAPEAGCAPLLHHAKHRVTFSAPLFSLGRRRCSTLTRTSKCTGRSEAPTGVQMQAVVDAANDYIAKDLPCSRFTMPREEAEGLYGTAM